MGEGGHLLLADDDAAMLKATSALLRHGGHQVDCVSSGAEAAERLAARSYDLLLADIHMPGNDQLELVRAFAGSPTPIIIITGHPTTQTAIEALRLRVVDYITKPLEPVDLLARVERAIRERQQEGSLEKARSRLAELKRALSSVETALGGESEERTDVAALVERRTLDLLSPREREVLQELLSGRGTKEIAERLYISRHTVRNHLKSIYKKLGVGSQSELIWSLLGQR